MGHLYVCWYLHRRRSDISYDTMYDVVNSPLSSRRSDVVPHRRLGSLGRWPVGSCSSALPSISWDEAYLNAMNPLDSDGPAVDAFA